MQFPPKMLNGLIVGVVLNDEIKAKRLRQGAGSGFAVFFRHFRIPKAHAQV